MSDLSTRTKYITGIVRLEVSLSKERIKLFNDFVTSMVCEYAYILHDKDKDENGNLIPSHIHFVLCLNSALRLSTVLNKICDTLDINEFGVTLSKTVSYTGAIQYLIHKNDSDKYKYSIDEIKTNIDDLRLRDYIDSSAYTVDFRTIYEICCAAQNITDVICNLGVHYYNTYRATIKDIYNEVKGFKHG